MPLLSKPFHCEWQYVSDSFQGVYREFVALCARYKGVQYFRPPVWGFWFGSGSNEVDYHEEYYSSIVEAQFNDGLICVRLKVPSDKVLLSDYAVWTSLIYIIDEKEPITGSHIEALFFSGNRSHAQVTIPFILPEWIEDIQQVDELPVFIT